jgi:DNA-binding PadR family transcriptional regulator
MDAGLSELEGVALGVVHTLQPCTSYAVRMEFERSPSTRWSASAGSIYPLLKRLEERGLVASSVDPEDGRGRRLLEVTPEGREGLEVWVAGGVDPAVVAAVEDPLRSRVFFLGLLPAPVRAAFLSGAESALRGFMAATRERLAESEASGDRLRQLADLGAVYQAEARVRWIEAVRDALGGGSG